MHFLLRVLRQAALAGCGAMLASGPVAAAEAQTVTLNAAQALEITEPSTAPPAFDRSVAVTLPERWTEAGHRVTWYRLQFDAPPVAPGTLLAAYLPRACSNAEVRLNSEPLHVDGRITEPVTRNCYRSQLIPLPAGLLRTTGNRLDVQVVGYGLPEVAARQRAGGLSEVVIGPLAELSGHHQRQLFWNVTLVEIIAATLVMIGCLMLALASTRRLGYLGYFGLLSIGWAALSARIWWADIPLSHTAVEQITVAGFVPVTVCALMFLRRYYGASNRRIDQFLWAQCVLMPGLVVVAGPQRVFLTATACYLLLALQVLGAIAAYLWMSWQKRRQDFWPLASIFAVAAPVIGLELAAQSDLLDLPDFHLIHFVIPLVFCAIALRLMQSFAQALRAAEAARGDLEARVREVSAQIERNFATLAEARVEQVAEKERKRIAADLHDDLGAKLLTIVHTSEDERISTLAREALEEMRLSVRGIAGKPVKLADALADWRAETVSRLGEAGIEVEWSGSEPAEPRTLPARTYVQTTRILREATSNLIKHSAASMASVTCTIGEDLELMIRDNGRGIPLELDGKLDRGHGMYSMKHRAKQMHGQCLVESGPGYGTVIRLTLPL